MQQSFEEQFNNARNKKKKKRSRHTSLRKWHLSSDIKVGWERTWRTNEGWVLNAEEEEGSKMVTERNIAIQENENVPRWMGCETTGRAAFPF